MSQYTAIKMGVLAAVASAQGSPDDVWNAVSDYMSGLAGQVNQLDESLAEALSRIEVLEGHDEDLWTREYFTSPKMGHVYDGLTIYDDIEVLKS